MANSDYGETPVVDTPGDIWGRFSQRLKESMGSTIKSGFTQTRDSNRTVRPPPLVLDGPEWPLPSNAGDSVNRRLGPQQDGVLTRRERCEQWLDTLSYRAWELHACRAGLPAPSLSKDAAFNDPALDGLSSDGSSADESAPLKSIFDDASDVGSTFADTISEGPIPAGGNPGFNGPAAVEDDFAFGESGHHDVDEFFYGGSKVGSKKTRSARFPKDYRRREARKMERSGSLRMERRREAKEFLGRAWG